MFGFNVFFWLIGIAAAAAGFYAWVEKDTLNNLSKLSKVNAILGKKNIYSVMARDENNGLYNEPLYGLMHVRIMWSKFVVTIASVLLPVHFRFLWTPHSF